LSAEESTKAVDFPRVSFGEAVKNPDKYQGRQVAVQGILSMKLESTELLGSCGTKVPHESEAKLEKGRPDKNGVIGLMMYDEVAEYGEKEANQYRENLRRYAKLNSACAWVVGVYYKEDRVSKMSSGNGMIKAITYIGLERP